MGEGAQNPARLEAGLEDKKKTSMTEWIRSRTIEEWLGALLMTVVVALLGWQVGLRFIMNQSLSWLEEVARFAFVWAVYFGFIIAAEKDRHIRVSLHIGLMPPFWQKVMLTLADLVWLVFNGVVVWYGAEFVASMFDFPFISQTTGINLAWVQMIVPLGFALMSVRIIQCMWRRWRAPDDAVDVADGRLND
ncbi:TRAP transporter small permease [Telmatospirillum sp. J64-1]|uniref:TRAP transporter small permease n=1 Tax=Telmatospirillum sp. J64-1 TaxID=2502183 RepID=UPI001C8F4925|nr:TRAP transporter small permease [Telmatospirillum sp. J64-1]